MSLEAWGDDNAGDYDHLLDAGWWSDGRVDDVKTAIKDLLSEPLYEDGKKENGVSPRFLARLTVLQHEAGLEVPPGLVVEAEKMFGEAGAHIERLRGALKQAYIDGGCREDEAEEMVNAIGQLPTEERG